MTALRLLDRRLRLCLLAIEAREEIGIAFRELAVDLQADVGPAANPLAVVQVRRAGRAIPRMCFVITAAGADRPRPARPAVRFFADVMRVEEGLLACPADAAAI